MYKFNTLGKTNAATPNIFESARLDRTIQGKIGNKQTAPGETGVVNVLM